MVPLERLRRNRKVLLDRCPRCEGVWIDRRELELVADNLGGIDAHAVQMKRFARRGGGIARCPACSSVPLEIPFFEMHIDYCADCRGVWLDGGERIGLARALEHEQPAMTTYRQAAEAVAENMARCRQCDARVPLSQTLMTADGVRCESCYQAALERAGNNHLELNAMLARIAVRDD